MSDMSLSQLSRILIPELDGPPIPYLRTATVVSVTGSAWVINIDGASVGASALNGVTAAPGAVVQVLTKTGAQPLVLGVTTLGGQAWSTSWGAVIPQTKLTTSGAANAGTATVFSAPAFVAVAGRKYEIAATFSEGAQVGAGVSNLLITDDVTQIASVRVGLAAGGTIGGTAVTTVVPGAATKTYRFRTSTSATTFQVVASGASPAEIIIKDIGPA